MNHDDATNSMTDESEHQRWIDELLRSSAAAELEAAPAGAKFATAAAIEKLRRRQKRRRTLAVFASAAAMAAVWAWPQSPLPRREGPGEGRPTANLDSIVASGATIKNSFPSPSLQGRGMIAATFVAGDDAIVVPVAVESPEVTVVQVYSTVDAQRRMQLAAMLSALATEPNGG